LGDQKPIHGDFRPGDVRHSLADISKARRLLGYEPTHSFSQGIALAMEWYRQHADDAGKDGDTLGQG
jgi:UDP-N-acetylglucosamine/UDP-N-acetylgalactosamine 4-epimerase